jgi:hypothetical protein
MLGEADPERPRTLADRLKEPTLQHLLWRVARGA